ncbi:MAG: DNA repair protein RadA [Rhodothalassiaceae bacterium]
MARSSTRYVCQSCGAVHPKWTGRCEECGAWNSISEETADFGRSRQRGGRRLPLVGLAEQTKAPARIRSGIAEFDRVMGGGLVPGSAVLVGGDPGIGKSTLLLEAMAAFARSGHGCVYVSGEEATAQIQMRAERLGLGDAPVKLAAATDLGDILATLDQEAAPAVLVIDSIQTMQASELESAPGTVGQVRAAAAELIRFAKTRGSAVLLVGHVTKDGQIAGPRVLEHMVDAVLYFEGERGHQYRILRSVKNRFGAVDEIGVFEMTGRGLVEVPNPSQLFLSDRKEPVAGSAIFAGVEGSRPLLVEIEALVSPTGAANPRRAVVGWDQGRLAMVLAVLDARCGLGLASADIYLNVAGGLRVIEPAADLAVAAALVSSLADRPVPQGAVLFGELSLSGDVRPVSQTEARLKEAAKLGFDKALLPAGSKTAAHGLSLETFGRASELVAHLTAGADGRTLRRRA